MRVTRFLTVFFLGLVVSVVAADKSYQPQIVPAEFRLAGDNPFYPFVPGTTWKYVEKSGGATSTNTITATHDTKLIMGVTCVVVHETVRRNGRIAEDDYTWVAQHKDGTVWCFGTAAKETSPGGKVSTEGSWEAGIRGAQPGVLMPGLPQPGKPYRQEYLYSVAENMAQIVATNESVTVPAGTFTGCVKTKEWSMLEAGMELKWYAKGVGVVKEIATAGDSAVLISITRE
jgi:hypothetical protein